MGPALMATLMVPFIVLSAIGAVGAAHHYRNANRVSSVVSQTGRVRGTLNLYAALVGEASASESVVVARATHVPLAVASRVIGIDIEAQLRIARAHDDTAIAAAGPSILGARVYGLVALRSQMDHGTASEPAVRSFFHAGLAAAEAAWTVQLGALTRISAGTVGSADLRRAVAGMADAVDAYISGAKMASAASALSVPGVPGASTGATDLAAANAIYTRAAARFDAELQGHGRAAWQQLILRDSDVRSFERFLARLAQAPGAKPRPLTVPEIVSTFRSGRIFEDHLRRVGDAAEDDIAPLAQQLRIDAQTGLERYLLGLGILAALSAAVLVAAARKIVIPLHRLAERAAEVSTGVINGDQLDTHGFYEVASVSAAFNEILANLRALEATSLALASADVDNPVVAEKVPGRIGDSLRHSVDLLRESIRDNEELRRDLTSSEIRFRELADASPDIIWRFARDPRPHFEYLSPSFETTTGLTASEVEADFGLFAAGLAAEGRELLADVLAGRPVPLRGDLTFRRADGTISLFELRAVALRRGLQGVARDVTEIRALQSQLAEQASRDPLTGLANRRLLGELLDRALRRADRAGTPVTVAFLDLDSFKSVNDEYGHDAGDTVLRTTAERLQSAVRDADVVARFGGDEFVVVCEGADDETGIVAERIEEQLSAPIDIGNGVTVRCRPSIGMASTLTTAKNANALINAADRAMLAAKRGHVAVRR